MAPTCRAAALLTLNLACPALGERIAVHSMQEAASSDGPGPVQVTLYLTRHALSCANAVSSYASSGFGRTAHVRMADPMLTGCGVHRSQRAGEVLKQQGIVPDLVLSSSLLRAMETAVNQYPGMEITPVPYISESSMGSDNTPLSLEEQREKVKAFRTPDGKEPAIDMRWMEHETFGGSKARESPSFDNFLRFLAENLLPRLPPAKQKQHLKIAVVTHSHFMRELELAKKLCKQYYEDKPRNNQVLQLDFDYLASLVLQRRDEPKTIAAMSMDPYTSEAGVLEADLAKLFKTAPATEVLQGALALDSRPPWKESHKGFLTLVRRVLTPQADHCHNVYAGEAAPGHLCAGDLGGVCDAEVEALSWPRPEVWTKEQSQAAAQKDLEKAVSGQEPAQKIESLKAKYEALAATQCCVPDA